MAFFSISVNLLHLYTLFCNRELMLFPTSTTQTTVPAPTRSARESCWEHRDTYFACLDRHNIVVPGQEAAGAKSGAAQAGADECEKERSVYGAECAASWVSLSLLHTLFTDFESTLFTSQRVAGEVRFAARRSRSIEAILALYSLPRTFHCSCRLSSIHLRGFKPDRGA